MMHTPLLIEIQKKRFRLTEIKLFTKATKSSLCGAIFLTMALTEARNHKQSCQKIKIKDTEYVVKY